MGHFKGRNAFLTGAAFAAAVGLGSFSTASAETLTIGVGVLPDSLGTRNSSFGTTSLLYQTQEPLVVRGEDSQPMPDLAERWENLDENTWRFHLRKGVKWHDGVEFTAEDVKDTLDYALDPKIVYGNKGRIVGISAVKVVDKNTVDIVTEAPFPTLLLGLSDIPIEPKHYRAKSGPEVMAKHPIGTGPFVFDKWVPGDRYELTANKDYWGGPPKVDRIVLRQIPEGATRVASLLAGETQIIEEVPVDLIPTIKANSATKIASVESTVGLCLTMDTRKPPFDNPKVRLAMDYAINKPLILSQMLSGNGAVLQGQLLTSNTLGHNPNIKARPHDPAKARQLLKEAGYPNGFETSITTRSGKYLSDIDITNVIAGMLREIGVKASVNVVEGGVFTKMAKAHDMGPMHIVGWYSVGDADLAAVWFTEGSERAFWKSEEYERLFVEGRSTVDRNKRIKAYHRMMEIMYEENPAVFLFGLPSIYATRTNVTNWWPPADKVLYLRSVELK
jgi:peptide/nickel transport system substrate-binding protein